VDVHLLVKNPDLRGALSSIVLSEEGACVDGLRPECVTGTCGHVVVATVSGCSVRQCRRLVERGARVILLAALPTEAERRDYMDAGASDYLPMGTNEEQLRGAVFGPRRDEGVPAMR
jgi:hypothetical protein